MLELRSEIPSIFWIYPQVVLVSLRINLVPIEVSFPQSCNKHTILFWPTSDWIYLNRSGMYLPVLIISILVFAIFQNLVALKSSQFSGYAQHDAQEFLAFLLDGLHEVWISIYKHFGNNSCCHCAAHTIGLTHIVDFLFLSLTPNFLLTFSPQFQRHITDFVFSSVIFTLVYTPQYLLSTYLTLFCFYRGFFKT